MCETGKLSPARYPSAYHKVQYQVQAILDWAPWIRLTVASKFVAVQRNATLKDALEIANEQQADSSAQAKLLGKYSNLINENAEKISQASHLLQDQV